MSATKIDCKNGCFRVWDGNELIATYYREREGCWILDLGYEPLWKFALQSDVCESAINGVLEGTYAEFQEPMTDEEFVSHLHSESKPHNTHNDNLAKKLLGEVY